MQENTQNQLLNLALHAWAAGEEDVAKTILEKVANNPDMPEGLGEKQAYLEFAGIFPSWLSILLDAKIPMDTILDGGEWHSRRFLENAEITDRFFQTYPHLLDRFSEGWYWVDCFDVNDENLRVTLDYLPYELQDIAQDLLCGIGDLVTQSVNFLDTCRRLRHLTWDSDAFQQTTEHYFSTLLDVYDVEEEVEQARILLGIRADLEGLEKLPEALNPSSKRPLKL